MKNILQALKVAIDERDVSMDREFRRELKALATDRDPLPQVFVGDTWVGGAQEVRRMHEEGELERIMDTMGVQKKDGRVSCKGCGCVRFLICGECSGGKKVNGGDGRRRLCLGCNENGLVRCSACW